MNVRSMKPSRMKRTEFESCFEGDWIKIPVLGTKTKLRRNGVFSTYQKGGLKFCEDGINVIQANSWFEIWNVLFNDPSLKESEQEAEKMTD